MTATSSTHAEKAAFPAAKGGMANLEDASSSTAPAGSRVSELTVKMRASPIWMALAMPMFLTVVLGWLDQITSWEISWFIFYAVPIIMAVWWAGVRGGMLTAIFSGAVWWVANRYTSPYKTEMGYAWAMLNREFYFCVLVFAVNAVRGKQDADAAHIRMLEERRQLEKDIVSVSEHEQQRIGQDLHDGLCQQLAAIGCALHALAEDLYAQRLPAAQDAALVEESVQQAVADARNLARGIFPVHVDHAGFSAALKELAGNTSRLTGVSIVIQESGETQIENPKVAMHLYRIAQEAVANAVRHGGAREIVISVNRHRDALELNLEDNGTGLPEGSPPTAGMGLRTMRYRAQSLGASFEIMPRRSGPGTCVRCCLPIKDF
ncbi:sensor histidine kinase [Prosthecobacter vanneervenii]|uniref:histidine kinase n=1 Tax=Prosthecobacter vanneervenii TaxID=48466 RepID=A0A7W7YCL0_9BACT|nr:sensor histidine kinase [Prosthecobacter vanneervenii]MBB5033537.1 signal transduction histidine kinase [Prosthecobacter vanneervenii]